MYSAVFYVSLFLLATVHTASVSKFSKSDKKRLFQKSNQGKDDASGCYHDSKKYQHGDPLTSSDPCEPCLCFRGEVLCYAVRCPAQKPSPECIEVPVADVCCPVFQCPTPKTSTPSQMKISPLAAPETETKPSVQNQTEMTQYSSMQSPPFRDIECEAGGQTFKAGQIISSHSGPCLECRCGVKGYIRCASKSCDGGRPSGDILRPSEERPPVHVTKIISVLRK